RRPPGLFALPLPCHAPGGHSRAARMAIKILVVAAAGIGDCLIATPLIHELRANFPQAEIHALVVWPGSKDFLEGNPHLNAIHQKNLVTDSKVESLRFLAGLRQQRYDI